MSSFRTVREAARRRGRLSLILVLLGAGGSDAAAQAPPSVVRSVAGRVVRPAGDSVAPLAGAEVVLHRVGPDTAGAVDSARSGARGEYSFRYRPTGSPDAVYFVSAEHGGVAYFTPPLQGNRVTGEEAEILVFDTTSAPISIAVRGRHLVVSMPRADGTREVLEVFELANDTTVARVAGSRDRAVWSTVLPGEARDPTVAGGDIPAGAVTFADGRALVFAPIPPGLRQLAFTYTLPADALPLSVLIAGPVSVLEVLLEEPGATVDGAGLAPQEAVAVEGRTFSRWLAQEAPANAVVRVAVPATPSTTFGGLPRGALLLAGLLIAFGTAMLIALARAFARRRAVAAGPLAEDPERIARRIADLDAAFERQSSPTPEARAAYASYRDDLKAQLNEALAQRGRRA